MSFKTKNRQLANTQMCTHVCNVHVRLGLTWNGAIKVVDRDRTVFCRFWRNWLTFHIMVKSHHFHTRYDSDISSSWPELKKAWMRLLFQKLVACENKSQRRYNISCNCLFLLAHSLLDSNIGLQGCPMMQHSNIFPRTHVCVSQGLSGRANVILCNP